MASGKLGSAALVATVKNTLYTCPANTVASATIRLLNKGAAASTVTLWVTTTPGAPVDADLIVPAFPLIVGAIDEETGIVIGAGESVVALASVAGVTCRVHGFESDA